MGAALRKEDKNFCVGNRAEERRKLQEQAHSNPLPFEPVKRPSAEEDRNNAS